MKEITDIERLSPEDLERIASDSSVRVPADLKASLEALAGAAELAELAEADEGAAAGAPVGPQPPESFPASPKRGFGRKSSGRRSQGPRFFWYWAAPAVAAALVAAVLIFRAVPEEPKDTFSDPYLAYAQVQKTFDQISRKGDKAARIAGNAVPVMEKTEELINRIMK